MDGMRGLDAWITSGRYSKETILVRCRHCDEETMVEAETEYGATEWSVEACEHCKKEFTGDEEYSGYDPRDEEPADFDDHYYGAKYGDPR
jgi:hypothetical protein